MTDMASSPGSSIHQISYYLPLVQQGLSPDFNDGYTSVELSFSKGPHWWEDNVYIPDICLNKTQIQYGNAFAYLYRRFGAPEYPSDEYKQLVSYRLTTGHPDYYVLLSPYTDDSDMSNSISFGMMTTYENHKKLVAYEKREQNKWYEEFTKFLVNREFACKQNAMEYGKKFNTRFSLAFGVVFFAHPRYENEDPATYQEAKALQATFESKHPFPGHFIRNENPDNWEQDDPLREVYSVFSSFIEDLMRPVSVRDTYFNLLGPVDESFMDEDACVEYHSGAGAASGALSNENRELYNELVGYILDLGNMNAIEGMQKAIEIVKAELENTSGDKHKMRG